MSYQTFFSFSSGLATSLHVPNGTKESIIKHVLEVEAKLNLVRTQYKDNPVHWDSFKMKFSALDDKVVCETVSNHNEWVRRMYEKFGEWSAKPVKDGEEITPDDAKEFWHGFQLLHVAPSQWTMDYYTERMECLYEVMRGREKEGIIFDEKPLTAKQCAAVIKLFSQFLDTHDLRLDVPNGHDYLASSYDGGYDWCEKCGPMVWEDAQACRKRKCPLRERE